MASHALGCVRLFLSVVYFRSVLSVLSVLSVVSVLSVLSILSILSQLAAGWVIARPPHKSHTESRSGPRYSRASGNAFEPVHS